MPGHTNVFLVINLGCEMLYVIDQRLKAQCITVEKSAQGESSVGNTQVTHRVFHIALGSTPVHKLWETVGGGFQL